MNQITLSERPTAANLPALLEEVDELRPSFKMIHEIFLASHIREDYGHRDDIERARAILPSAEAWLRTAQFHSTSDAIARVSASAEPTLIRAELKRLISAWPSAKADLAGFAALLAFDVRSMRPTRYGVIVGCRNVRRESKFLPSISEVIGAISSAEQEIERQGRRFAELPAMVKQMRLTLESAR